MNTAHETTEDVEQVQKLILLADAAFHHPIDPDCLPVNSEPVKEKI